VKASGRGVLLVGTASGYGGGQDIYERDLTQALADHPAGIDVRHRAIDVDDRGLLLRLLSGRFMRAGRALRRPLGPLVWDRRVVHRVDLRLPPGRIDILTIHDVAPLLFPDEVRIATEVWAEARRAHAVITASHFAADEIRRVLGVASPIVIPHGVPSDVASSTALDGQELRSLGIGAPYVLHVGGATKRKNLPMLYEAWRSSATMRAGATLVSCGPMTAERTAQLGRDQSVHVLGLVPRRVVLGLMRSAQAVVIPSSYEGFGLPLLEAMAMGTPAVALRTPTSVEVCGDAATLVEADPQAMAAGIDEVFELRAAGRDGGLKARAAGFTWARAAAAHAEVYRRFVD
jgi:glycosyltransferase involved in cell wall biosynthesis